MGRKEERSATGEPIPVGRHELATSARLTPEALHAELKRATRKGARASRLVRYSPVLIELLCPEEGSPDLSIYDRAIAAEQVIREAVSAIGGASGEALGTILCLQPATLGLNLEARRRMAAELLDVQADTFRRERHEGMLIWDLAMEVYGRGSASTPSRLS